ncbi:MAG: helix-turn-helix domain-containing protein [Anaerolineae bacterium]|nr:helix-turn-helix domain-containing protein [Anaerolineae bacterium]
MGHQKTPHTPGGARLRALRAAYGKTQLALELEASLGMGYLQRLELGKVQYPERDTLERILTALGVSFVERREVLGLFGYTAVMSMPTDAEICWASEVFHAEIRQDNIPVYLLDCSHRLLAWNSMVGKVIGAVNSEVGRVTLPRLIFDPAYEVAPTVLNAEDFYSAEVRILQFERQRSGDEMWYRRLIDEMRHYRLFDEYWTKHNVGDRGQVPMRPTAQLQLNLGHGVAQFRLISETFAQDPRFRVIYYLPADAVTMRQCLAWQG